MKSDHNIDQWLKNQLNSEDLAFNDVHWDATKQYVANREKARKRRAVIWWSSAAVLLIGIIVGGLAIFDNGNAGTSPKHQIAQKRQTQDNHPKSTDDATKSKAQKGGNNGNTDRDHQHETLTQSTTSQDGKNTKTLSSSYFQTKTSLQADSNGHNTRTDDKQVKWQKAHLAMHDAADSGQAKNDGNTDANKTGLNTDFVFGKRPFNSGPFTTNVPNGLALFSNVTQTPMLPIAKDLQMPIPGNSPSEPKQLVGWFMMPYFGVNHIKGSPLNSPSDVLRKRSSEEFSALTPSLGFMARYHFKSGYYAGAGIGTFQTGENAQYAAITHQEITERPVTRKVAIDRGGLQYTDSVVENGETIYTQYEWVSRWDTTRRVHYITDTTTHYSPAREVQNRFKYISIPVVLGYQWQFNRWLLGIDAGPTFNILQSANGQYPNAYLTKFEDVSTNSYKRLTFGMSTGAGVGRMLGKHWVYHVSLRYNNQLGGNANVSNQTISNTQYQAWGVRTRLLYRF